MNASTLRLTIAAVLCAALTLTAPGLPAYAAAGQARAAGAAGNVVPPAAVVAMPAINAGLAPSGVAGTPSLGAPSLTLPSALPSAAALPGFAAASAARVQSVPGSAAARSALAETPAHSAPNVGTSALSAGKSVASAAATAPAAAGHDGSRAAGALSAAERAASAAAPRAEAGNVLGAAFDGSPARPSAADGVTGAQGGALPALAASKAGADGPAAQRDGGQVPPSAPNGSDGSGPQGPRKPSLWLVLGAGAAVGAAAYLLGPVLVAHLSPRLALIGAHSSAARAVITLIGALAGIAASQRETWAGFPAALRDASVRSGASTFRFWGRFGLIFDAVLRGKSADEAMKAELPANVLRYPLPAWPFVLVGYVCAPLAFTLGLLYKSVETPVRAALRGLTQIALDFFPWLADVLRLVKRIVLKIVPFTAGLVWGALRGEGVSIAVGAFALAAPVFKDVVAVSYRTESVPGWIGARLVQLGGLIVGVTAGALGGAVGLLVGAPFALTESARQALDWAGSQGRARRALEDWQRAAGELDGPQHLADFPFAEGKLGVGQGLTRLVNLRFVSFYMAPVLALSALLLYGRAWVSVAKGQTPKESPRPDVTISEREGAEPAGEGYGAGIARVSRETAETSWSIWKYVGAASDAALRGRVVAKGESAWLGAPGLLVGGVAMFVGAVAGGVLQVLVVPARALWRGIVTVVKKFWPTLKRVLDFAWKVVRKIVPFTFGFVFGSVEGLVRNGVTGATYFGAPFGELFDYAGGLSDDVHVRYAVQASMVLVAIPALVTVVAGFIAGLVAGIPAALTQGAAKGVDWAGTGAASEKWAQSWRTAFRAQGETLSAMSARAGSEGARGDGTAFRTLASGLNLMLAAPVQAVALTLAWLVGYPRALGLSQRLAAGEKPAPRADRATADETEPAQAQRKPWVSPSPWVAAGLGLAALAVSAFAPAYLLVFLGLAGWKLWLASAAVIALSGAAGLAVSQPSFWTRLPGDIKQDAAAGASATWRTWSRLGDGFAGGLLGRAADGSPLGWLHRAVGGLLAAPWALAGAVYAVGTLGLRASYEGAKQVVENLLPFLRGFLRTALRIVKRIVPFVVGLVGGLFSGVVGSAVFGALLLGRPYFKHVVAQDFETGSLGQALGNVALKGAALVLGVGFGLVGLVAGVAAALPYALTLVPSMAFQLAEIGGAPQRFFDLWSKGALRMELRRLNLLTDRFEFPEAKSGRLALVDGWVRLANIFPATFAAAIAATIAGYAAYFRSLRNAWRDLKAGKPAPSEGFDDMSSVGRAASRGARIGGKTTRALAGWGALVVLSFLALKHGALGGVAKALGIAPLAWLGGWAVGALVGAAAGFGVGLVLWLADQLGKEPVK